MLTVACCFWSPNENSRPFSAMYTEAWADKLYRGFKRNLTVPFRFVAFVDVQREFGEPEIEQETLGMRRPDYGAMIEPFRLDEPCIVVGLDTIVVGNIDHLAEYALTADRPAVPLDPFFPNTTTNSVVVAPKGCRHELYDMWAGQNDMDWIRSKDCAIADDLWPGQILSYKAHVKEGGLGEARIVYFHGFPKPDTLNEPWIAEHWR